MNNNTNNKLNTVSKLKHHIKLDLVINCAAIVWKMICHRNNK